MLRSSKFFTSLFGRPRKSPATTAARFDYKSIQQHRTELEQNCLVRNVHVPDLSRLCEIYETSKKIQSSVNEARSKKHQVALEGNQLLKNEFSEEFDEKQRQGKELKGKIKKLEEELEQIREEMAEIAALLPNSTHPAAPLGLEPKIIGMNGKVADLPTLVLDHLEIGKKYDLFDFENAASTSGHNFYYLRNDAVLLEFALIQHAIEVCRNRGYTPITTPDIVKTEVLEACGFRPRDAHSSQTYNVTHDKFTHAVRLSLAGTAEVPCAGMFSDKILTKLPEKLVAFGRCYRAEAGGRGRENRGLYRVHQFSKVEMFTVSDQGGSDEALQEILSIQQQIFSQLELIYRVLEMPTEELGQSAYQKYDIEAWMPGKKFWGEISSASNCTDYQSRRLNIRYRHGKVGEKVPFAHTLNGTACAIPRTIIAILEQRQDSRGRISIPQVLRKWMNEREFIGE